MFCGTFLPLRVGYVICDFGLFPPLRLGYVICYFGLFPPLRLGYVICDFGIFPPLRLGYVICDFGLFLPLRLGYVACVSIIWGCNFVFHMMTRTMLPNQSSCGKRPALAPRNSSGRLPAALLLTTYGMRKRRR